MPVGFNRRGKSRLFIGRGTDALTWASTGIEAAARCVWFAGFDALLYRMGCREGIAHLTIP